MSGTIADYQPLQTTIPAYAYQEYADDENVVAFFTTNTQIAQGYLDWFNQTPLSVYTAAAISGALLDWTAQGIYGIARPVLSTLSSKTYGAINTRTINTTPINQRTTTSSGTAVVASDDIYKRVLTWHLYAGDGRQASIPWLRRRVARFVYGANGSDIDIGLIVNVGVTISSGAVTITVPNTSDGSFFKQCVDNDVLALPFQLTYTVTLA